MKAEQLEQRIYALATVINFDLREYLDQAGRNLVGLAKGAKRDYPLFGSPPDELLQAANERRSDSVSGYSVDAGAKLGVDARADVILFSEDLLRQPVDDVESIIIHELVHALIGSGNDAPYRDALTDEDETRGARLYDKTDAINEQMTQHTLEFCTVLCWATRTWADATGKMSADHAAELAMRYDIEGGFRQ